MKPGRELRFVGAVACAQDHLAHPRVVVTAAVLGVVLCLPSLWIGFVGDDYHHRSLLTGATAFPELAEHPLNLFSFLDGDVERTRLLKEYGLLPWWVWENIRAAMWRPVTSALHWMDYRLWPDAPWLMHAHNLLWYAGVILVAGVVYRRLIDGAWVAGLATLLFAVDHVHGLPVGWIANRNTLMATFFGLATLLFHDRARRDERRLLAPLALVSLTLGLLSAEAAVATGAFLFAYALRLDQGSPKERALSLVPYGVLIAIWRVTYSVLGYGVSAGGLLYIDPGRDPLRFPLAVIDRVPVLLLGEWIGPPTEVSIFLSPSQFRVMWLVALLLLGILAFFMAPLLRRDRSAQFWAIATLGAAVPICATFPMDRLLFFVSFSSMGLMSQFFSWVAERGGDASEGRKPRYRLVSAIAVVLVALHLVLAPPLLALRSWSPRLLLGDVLEGCERMAPRDPELCDQDLVWVNGGDLCPGYVPIIRSLTGQPYPRRMRSLAGPHRPIELTRVDERTVVLKPVDGFLANPLERWLDVPFSLGHTVDLTGMRVEVLEITPDGRPAAARFTFDVPIEDPSLRWIQWNGMRVEPVELPPIGASTTIPAGFLFSSGSGGRDR
jgi:hypothetical protein